MAHVDLGIVVTLFDHASTALKGINRDLEKTKVNAQAAHFQLRAIQVVLVNIVATRLYQFGAAFAQTSAAIDQATRRLAFFAGGTAKAAELMDGFGKKFAAAGFQNEDLANNFIKLRASGLGLDDTSKLLDAIANSVAAMGGNASNIEVVTDAFSRMSQRGTLNLRDLNAALGTNLPFAMQTMADGAGVSIDRFTERVQKGLVDSKTAIELFVQGSKKTVGNFGQELGDTMFGSLKILKDSWSNFVKNLTGNTSLDERLVITFQRMARAIDDIGMSIADSDIKLLFSALEGGAGVVAKFTPDLVAAGRAFVSLFALITQVISILPPEVTEYGILVWLFLGKKGLLVGSAIAAGLVLSDKIFRNTEAGLATIYQWMGLITGETAEANKKYFEQNSVLSQIFASISNLAGLGSDALPSTDWSKAIDDIRKSWEELAKKWKAGLTDGSGNGAGGIEDVAQAIDQKLSGIVQRIDSVTSGLNVARSAGDDVAVGMAEIDRQVQGWRDSLQGAILDLSQIEDANQAQKATIAQLKALADHTFAGLLSDADSLKARFLAINALRREQAAIEQKSLQSQISMSAAVLEESSNYSLLHNVMMGTTTAKIAQQIKINALQSEQNIIEFQGRIKALEVDQKTYEADKDRAALIQKTIDLYKAMIDATSAAAAAMTPQAELTKEAARSLGDTIEHGIGDAITGVITGTQTMGDVMRSVYNEITNLAVRYLLHLAEIRVAESNIGSSGGGSGFMGLIGAALGLFGGASGASGATGAAGYNYFGNGGAFSGKVKPFANGDIIGGPTMFGIAGEVPGEREAIMPLKRIGGKLGVATDGALASHSTNIYIQAIDTQSGTEFLKKNIGTIASHLGYSGRLNRL